MNEPDGKHMMKLALDSDRLARKLRDMIGMYPGMWHKKPGVVRLRRIAGKMDARTERRAVKSRHLWVDQLSCDELREMVRKIVTTP